MCAKKEQKKEKVKNENPYIPTNSKVVSVSKETDDIKTFRIQYEERCMPGQFVQMSLMGIGECPISLSSYSKGYIDLTVRNVGNVTNAIHKLKPGSVVGIRGPYGNGYPMESMFGKDLLIIGGGTGAAPLRSVLQFVQQQRADYGKIDIFLGFRTPEDILFRKDIESWKKEFNVSITVDKADKGWKDHVGLITDMLRKSDISPENTIAVTCGPPIMIKFVVESLKEKGFDDHQIYLSLERNMKCGIGKCGHCMIESEYVCKDGPVFNYAKTKNIAD